MEPEHKPSPCAIGVTCGPVPRVLVENDDGQILEWVRGEFRRQEACLDDSEFDPNDPDGRPRRQKDTGSKSKRVVAEEHLEQTSRLLARLQKSGCIIEPRLSRVNNGHGSSTVTSRNPKENPFPNQEEDHATVKKHQTRRWVFTAYDVAETGGDWSDVLQTSDTIKDYFWGVEECPTTGTVHMHVGVRYHVNQRYSAVRKWLLNHSLRAWTAPMKGSWIQARTYAFKDSGNLRPDVVMSLPCAPQGRSNNPDEDKDSTAGTHSSSKTSSRHLTEEAARLVLTGRTHQAYASMAPSMAVKMSRAIRESLEIVPARAMEPVIIWVYGPTSCGKTTFAQWIASKHQTTAHWQGLEQDARFWNGYVGQEIVILDEARERNLPFQTFLRLGTRAPFNVELKNGHTAMVSPLIIVTAPSPPWRFWTGTVNQKGHPMDINQAMQRITITVEFLPPSTAKVMKFPMVILPMSYQTIQPLLEMTPISGGSANSQSAFSTIMDHVLNGSLPDGVTRHPTTDRRSARFQIDASSMLALPIVVRSITLKSEPRVKKMMCDEDVHWTDHVRMPAGLKPDQQHELLKSLSNEEQFVLFFAVHSRNLRSATQKILFRHYFGEFFDIETSEELPDEDYAAAAADFIA